RLEAQAASTRAPRRMDCRASRDGDRRRMARAARTTLASFERSQVADVPCELRRFPPGPDAVIPRRPERTRLCPRARADGGAGPEAIATTSNLGEAAEPRSGGLERGNPNSWSQFEL